MKYFTVAINDFIVITNKDNEGVLKNIWPTDKKVKTESVGFCLTLSACVWGSQVKTSHTCLPSKILQFTNNQRKKATNNCSVNVPSSKTHLFLAGKK